MSLRVSHRPAGRSALNERVRSGTRVSWPGSARCLLLLSALLFLSFAPALAGDTVPVMVRSGNHSDFGRVVFDAPPRLPYRVARDGDRIMVQFGSDVTLHGNPKPPRNVTAVQMAGAAAVLTVAKGANLNAVRYGDHVVIDVFDARPGGNEERRPSPAQRAGEAVQQRLATLRLPDEPPPPPSEAIASGSPSTPAATPPAADTILAQPAATSAAAPQSAASKASSLAVGASNAPPSAPPQQGTPPIATASPAASTSSETTANAATNASTAEQAALAASPVALPDDKGAAFLLPFSDTVGAAVFRRHGETLVAFDQRRAIDLSALQSVTALATAKVELLPAGTLIHLTPPAGTAVALSKTVQGWVIALRGAPPPQQPLALEVDGTALNVPAQQPGGVLSVADPLTGGRLLVGTQRQPGQAVVIPFRTPQFTLLLTTQGVAVAPLADTVALRADPRGFALTTEPAPLAVSRLDTDLLGDEAAPTRRFDFPNLPPEQLTARLATEIDAAAQQPLLARGPKRQAAALTMISLGMDAEAEALLQLTATDDPRMAASADIAALTGIAAILAGRPGEAAGLSDARLDGTDEIVLWRALRTAMTDEASQAAAIALAGTAALLPTYPPAIRDRVLPLAVETMVQGGARPAAAELLERCKDLPGLRLARAMLSQASGETDAALAQYDALAAGEDRLVRARAALRAINLRVASGRLDTRQAAEALDRQLYAWRGDRRELTLREELADLRQKLGEWRQALTLLRDSETLFPEEEQAIHSRLQAMFDVVLRDDAVNKLPPLEFVALVDENADLVPNTQLGVAMQAKLADRLLELDLPDRAGPVLDKLMQATTDEVGRATFGARLGSLRLREGDASGALTVLAASDAADLPAALSEQRLLLRADAVARQGDAPKAVAMLAALDSAAADAARAGILEQAADWVGAERALTTYAAKTVPVDGPLDDAARRTLLRLATAATRAGDTATLAALREHQGPRIGSGPLADMFRLLTAGPVQGPADLLRSAREVGLARTLPAALQAVRP